MGSHEAKRDDRRASETRAPLSRRDDAALVQRLIAGDEDAFRGLFERYHAALVRLARAKAVAVLLLEIVSILRDRNGSLMCASLTPRRRQEWQVLSLLNSRI